VWSRSWPITIRLIPPEASIDANVWRLPGRARGQSTIGTPRGRVRENGMPVSRGVLARDMMDWFACREDFQPPDERTVRQQVSAVLKDLSSA